MSRRYTKHGATRGRRPEPEYFVWQGMLARCRNPNHSSWYRYGGRGIRVCERWHSYEAFIEDMGHRPTPKHSLERVNNDGDYEPRNVVWLPFREQARNMERLKRYLYRGQMLLMVELHERSDLGFTTLQNRIRRGWDIERAVETPVRR